MTTEVFTLDSLANVAEAITKLAEGIAPKTTIYGYSIELALDLARERLTDFTQEPSFEDKIRLAFGNDSDVNGLRQAWQARKINFPQIEVRSSSQINGANGAFSVDTNKIYLSQEFLGENDTEAIANLLLEEYGHYIDSRINSSDTPGDEGAIFAALVLGEDLGEDRLQKLREEDDSADVVIDGKKIAIEQAVDLTQVATGFNTLLDTLQNAIESQIFGNSLPLFGNSLKDSTANSVQFIENLRYLTNDELQQLENPTAQDIKQVLASTLGDYIEGEIQLDESDPNDVKFSLALKEISEDSIFLDSNLGLPHMGLTVEGSADVGIDYDFQLDFGVDSNGVYYNTSSTDELRIDIDTSVPLDATGMLGLLQVDVTDNSEDPTKFLGAFNVDLNDLDNKLHLSELSELDFANLVDATFDGQADINLKLKTTADGSTALPSIGADLNLDWSFSNVNADPNGTLQNFGDVPTVAFDNVKLYLGSFFSDFATPVLETVQSLTKPIQPIVDALVTPIDLKVAKFNLLDIAERLGYTDSEVRDFIDSIAALTRLVNSIPHNSDLSIKLDGFKWNGDVRDPNFNFDNINLPDTSNFSPIDQFPVGSSEAKFYSNFTSIPGAGLQFPLLDDPTQAYNLLLGNYDEVTFFTYDMPSLNFEADYSQFFPIIGPLGAEVRGTFGAGVDLEFGFDGAGIKTLNPNGSNPELFDGFFVVDTDAPEVSLDASLEAFAAVNAAVASTGVGGGIYGDIDFDLNDSDNDGKIRYGQISLAGDIADIFTTSGELSAGLSAYLKVGTEPFAYTKRFNSPRVTLLSFDGEDKLPDPQLTLAILTDGVLRLNIGSHAADRKVINTEDGSESFSVYSSPSNNSTAIVSAFDGTQRFTGVSKIVADAGEEDDIISLNSAFVPAKLSGGNGDDELIGGNEEDSLYGNSGWDRLYGGNGNDSLFGGQEDDFLIGGAGADVLDGGEGYDIASYDTSEGVSLNLATGEGTGHATGDVFESIEQIDGSFYDDTLTGGAENDKLGGNDGNDIINGGSGDDILLPGYGDDAIDGGAGNDLLAIDYSNLPTAAVVWWNEAANSEAQDSFFVGNAYGMELPRQRLDPTDQYDDYHQNIAIAADGSTVVWTHGEINNLYIQKVGSSAAPTVIPTEELNYSDRSPISISADGSKIAWVSNLDSGVYVANSDGTGITKIIDAEEDYRQLRQLNLELPEFTRFGIEEIQLSGDGTKLIWNVWADYPVDGTSEEIADGKKISYISVANADRTEQTRSPYLIDGSHHELTISQDGSKVAWTELISPEQRIALADSDFSEITTVTNRNSALSDIAVDYPSLSADGSTLAWVARDFDTSRIFVAKNNSAPIEVFDSLDHDIYDLSLSPDGDLITFNSTYPDDEQSRLYVVDADGNSPPTLIPTDHINLIGIDSYRQSLSAYVDSGVRYEDFDPNTGSGEIITWGPSHVQFDNIERFDLTGTIYDDELFGGSLNDSLSGAGGADTLEGGGGDDIYELDPETAAGSQIQDTGGNDTLNLITIDYPEQEIQSDLEGEIKPEQQQANLSLSQPTKNTIGLKRENSTLIIDIDRDGDADSEGDLSILNYFNDSGTDAGVGFIENVANLSGTDIINFLKNGAKPPPNSGTSLQGTSDSEELTGDSGDDTLIGAGGDDTLRGGKGKDRLDGGVGNDIIDGGVGADTLTGSEGSDTFVGNLTELNGDLITDFTAEDVLLVKDANFASENLTVTNNSAILDIDTDLNGTSDFTLTLEGDFTAAEFVIEPGSSPNSSDTFITINNSTINSEKARGSTVYRFFNPLAGVHFYTADGNESDYVRNNLDNYVYEGESYVTVDPVTGDSPEEVYRFFNSTTGVHLYTTDENERDYIVDNLNNFVYENVKFHAFEIEVADTVPIHRFYEPNIGVHFYTPNEGEKIHVENNLSNYTYEGIAYYAYPIGNTQTIF